MMLSCGAAMLCAAIHFNTGKVFDGRFYEHYSVFNGCIASLPDTRINTSIEESIIVLIYATAFTASLSGGFYHTQIRGRVFLDKELLFADGLFFQAANDSFKKSIQNGAPQGMPDQRKPTHYCGQRTSILFRAHSSHHAESPCQIMMTPTKSILPSI